MTTTVRVSESATLYVAALANKEGLTIPEATERLITMGFTRINSLKKWRRKEKREARRHG
jgi:hypothetical protein